jgi:hypothetical protein
MKASYVFAACAALATTGAAAQTPDGKAIFKNADGSPVVMSLRSEAKYLGSCK